MMTLQMRWETRAPSGLALRVKDRAPMPKSGDLDAAVQ